MIVARWAKAFFCSSKSRKFSGMTAIGGSCRKGCPYQRRAGRFASFVVAGTKLRRRPQSLHTRRSPELVEFLRLGITRDIAANRLRLLADALAPQLSCSFCHEFAHQSVERNPTRIRLRLQCPSEIAIEAYRDARGHCVLRAASHIEAEMHDVAVLHDVIGAFEAHPAGVLGALLAAMRDEIGVGDRFGADEALLEIAVDDPGGLRRLGAARDRPGARLLRAGGQESEQIQERVAG